MRRLGSKLPGCQSADTVPPPPPALSSPLRPSPALRTRAASRYRRLRLSVKSICSITGINMDNSAFQPLECIEEAHRLQPSELVGTPEAGTVIHLQSPSQAIGGRCIIYSNHVHPYQIRKKGGKIHSDFIQDVCELQCGCLIRRNTHTHTRRVVV